MPLSNYPHGFPNGLTVRENPIVSTQNKNGNVFWVDSVQGSDNNKGTFKYPFATLDYAIGRCTADQSDKIFVAAGHTESVIAAGGVTCDVAGIIIQFMGEGANNATVDFGTAVTASMVVSAANVALINPRFTASIDALTGPISITGANCSIEQYKYYDGTSIDTTDGVIVAATATGFAINGFEYIPGDEGGTQKQSHIQLDGVDNAILENIKIAGDFGTGDIENVTDELLNVRLENIILNNTNSGPIPGIVLDANSTGQAKNIDIRIASGSTYVSDLAKLNWDIQCLGYAADGTGGDPIGTAGSGTIEAQIVALQADVGDPSARANFQSLETMIGIPDAANSNVDDIIRTGYDSTVIGSNADGSIIERLEFIQTNMVPDVSGLVYSGSCDVGMTGSTTAVVAANLAGYGDDVFNTKYYMQIIKNDNSVGTTPETQVRQITDYVSATGTFTVTAFGANVEESDIIMILHETLVAVGRDDANNTFDSSNVVANADGSSLERLEFIQSSIIPDVSGLVFAGVCTTGMVASTTTIVSAGLAGYGDDLFNDKYYLQIIRNTNAVGTAPEREVQLITNYVSTTGTFTTAAFTANVEEADNILVIHESLVIAGRDDANNAFASTNVVANADGSSLERQEYIQAAVGNPSGETLISLTAKLGDGATTVTADLGTLKTNVGDASGDTLTSVVAKLGDGATTVTADLATAIADVGTANTNIGDASGDTLISVVAKLGDGATTVTADLAAIQAEVDKIDSATLAIDPTAGSIGSFVASGGTALGTQLADSKSLVDALGTNGTTVADSAVTVLGAVGANNAANAFDSSTVAADADGSVLERLEFSQDAIAVIDGNADKIDSATLAVDPTAGSLARFVASGGTALGTPLADSKSLIDALGTDGTTVTDGTVSVLGAIGANNNNNAFDSSLVSAATNGSVLERLEFVQGRVDTISSASLPVNVVAGSLGAFVASGGTALGTELADSKSIVDVLGSDGTTVADSAVSVLGAVGANNAANAFDSSTVVADEDGSVLERLEHLKLKALTGLTYSGRCDAGMTGSTTDVVCADLKGYIGGSFANKYYLQITLNNNGPATAPETQVRKITAYASVTGTFTTDAFTVNVEQLDGILVIHESLVIAGRNDADNTFASNAVVANEDGSLIERQEHIQEEIDDIGDEVDKIDSDSLDVDPTAGSIASFIASGGTALGTQLADSKSLVDAIGSNGTTLVYGSGSVLGAIGTSFSITKLVTSSNITFGAAVDLTTVSSGSLVVEEVILSTDVTGLATGTNLKILSNNSRGNPVILEETVANLGASQTVDMGIASIRGVKCPLEAGKKLQIQSTIADCTGGGIVYVTVKLNRTTAGATVAAA